MCHVASAPFLRLQGLIRRFVCKFLRRRAEERHRARGLRRLAPPRFAATIAGKPVKRSTGSRGFLASVERRPPATVAACDGGRSSTRVEPPVPSSDVLHAGPDACVLLGEQGVPVVTRDQGRSWATLAPLPAGVASPRLERAPHAWWAIADTGGVTSVLLVLRDDASVWERLTPVWDDRAQPPPIRDLPIPPLALRPAPPRLLSGGPRRAHGRRGADARLATSRKNPHTAAMRGTSRRARWLTSHRS